MINHPLRGAALVLFLNFVVVTTSADDSPAGVRAETLKSVRGHLRAAVDEKKIAGGSHLVWLHGHLVYLESAGYRDIDQRGRFAEDTLLRIYSMSKPITSVAAMTLYEQGKFRLEDPVSRFIPAFRKTTVLTEDGKIVPANREITVLDVFRHTTGFSYGGGRVQKYYEAEGMRYRDPAAMFPPDMPISQAADALARIPALHHPGEQFTYGFNTDLLGRLIEVWSGETLDNYLRKSVLQPLKMRDTFFQVPRSETTRFASCHTREDGRLAILDKSTRSPYLKGFKFLSGGGGLVSTIGDYSRFCQMLINDGRLDGIQVLKPATLKMMFSDQLNGVAGDFRFGLGFRIQRVKLGTGDAAAEFSQYSWGGYASTDFRVIPEQKAFQIVMRQHIPSAHGLAKYLMDEVAKGITPAKNVASVSKALRVHRQLLNTSHDIE